MLRRGGPHNHHRALGSLDDLLGHASHEDLAHPGPSEGTHYDDVVILGDSVYRSRRDAFHDLLLEPDAGRRRLLLDIGDRLAPLLLEGLVDVDDGRIHGHVRIYRLVDHIERRYGAFADLGQFHGLVYGRVGENAPVGGEQDLFETPFLLSASRNEYRSLGVQGRVGGLPRAWQDDRWVGGSEC